MNHSATTSASDKARESIIDACAQTAKIWGYSDASGILKGTLMLASGPLSMDELVEETGYSKSTVSTNITLLENLGFVRRVRIPGDKRHHYVSVTGLDPLHAALMTNVQREVQVMQIALDQADRDLLSAGENVENLQDRIAGIRHFYRQAAALLNLISKYTTEELIDILERADKK
jgi:DNA-binding transcriptional regulator GbsR (MarR family)